MRLVPENPFTSDVVGGAFVRVETRGVNESSPGKLKGEDGKEPPVGAAAKAGEEADPGDAMREIEPEVFKFRAEDEVLVFLGVMVGVGGHGCGIAGWNSVRGWVDFEMWAEGSSVRELEVVRDALEQFRPREFVDPQPGMEIRRGREAELEKSNQVRLEHGDLYFAARPLDERHIGHNAGGDHAQTIAFEIREKWPAGPARMAEAVKFSYAGDRAKRFRFVVEAVYGEPHLTVKPG